MATFLEPHFRQFSFVGNEIIRAQKLGEARDFLIVEMRKFARQFVQISSPAQSADIQCGSAFDDITPSAPKKKRVRWIRRDR